MIWSIAIGLAALAAGVGWWREHLALRRLRAGLPTPEAAGAELRQRLAELERAVAENQAILRNALDGFFLLGEDYRFLKVNPAFCRMLGYTEAELQQLKMVDLEVSRSLTPETTTRLRTGLHHFATAHRHKSGRIVQLESCIVVLREGGQTVLAGFARDVTERYRAEEALARSEEQYRNLVEASRDLIWSVDVEGRWTFVNNAVQEIYGYSPAEMLGRRFTEFVAPHRIEADLHAFGQIKGGEPVFRYETEHLRRDGRPVHLSFNALPLYDEQGRAVGTTGTARDITEQLDAERKIRTANARFQSIVAEMPLGYVVWTEDQRITEWNPAAHQTFGYTREEALGQSLAELLIPESARPSFADMCRHLSNGVSLTGVVLTVRRKPGETLACEWFNTVLHDAEGRLQCIVSLIRDISEKSRLEAKLQQAQKLESLGVLAGGIAHDFNNLLVGIMGNASLALEQAQGPVAAYLERVVNAAMRAADLTQRMLAYAGRAAIDVQPMDLNERIQEVVDLASAALPKNAQLQLELEAGLPLIEGDSGQLQQVVMNLLINAAEALGERRGVVTVSTWSRLLRESELDRHKEFHLTPGEYVELQVQDTGCGMSPQTLERIFEPFFSTKFAGRGLGLSSILGIVRAHRGAIQVTSTENVGTTFRLLFPVCRQAKRRAPRPTLLHTLPRNARLLVIDDEPEIRDVVRSVLEARGVQVLTAENGAAGVEVFRRRAHEIDAVLLDVNMPGMGGADVCRELVAIRPDVKVILTSGYAEQEAASHFEDLPLAGFVHKPYTAGTLVEKLGAALAPHA